MSIQGLPLATDLEPGDSIPVGDMSDGADSRASLSLLAAFMREQIAGAGKDQVQYEAPNGTGFAVTVAPTVAGNDVWLMLAPLAAYAGGTIILPPRATLLDGQEVLVTSTQAITALATNGNGAAAVNGAPAGMTAHGSFRLRYTAIGNAWQRIG